jgi:hypothetical protein
MVHTGLDGDKQPCQKALSDRASGRVASQTPDRARAPSAASRSRLAGGHRAFTS